MSATWGDGAVNATIAFAVGIVRTWVALYTFGLPQKLREARRLEIDCDLWEQRRLAEHTREPPIATAIEMVVRTLLGAISDITWRVELGSSARRSRSLNMNDSIAMRGIFLLAAGFAAAPAFFGVYMIGGGGEWDSATERVLVGLLAVSAAVPMVAGLVLSAKRPVLGIGLVLLGTALISGLWYWAAVITAPIGLTIAAVAYLRARGTGWPNRARAA